MLDTVEIPLESNNQNTNTVSGSVRLRMSQPLTVIKIMIWKRISKCSSQTTVYLPLRNENVQRTDTYVSYKPINVIKGGMNPDVHSYVREIYELWTIAASSSDKGFHNCQFNILCSPCISFILKMVQAYRNVESCLLYSNIYCIHHTLKRKFDTREIYYTQNFIYFKYFYVLSSMGSFRKLRLIFFYYMYM